MNIRLCSAGLIWVLLAGCSDTPDSKKAVPVKDHEVIQAVQEKPLAGPTAEELARADRILAYHNKVHSSLAKGTLADKIYANTRFYAANWLLPVRQKAIRPKALAAPRGLFNGEEEIALTRALDGMDRALNAMLGHYAELEKYVLNHTIQDDGKQGKIYVEKIQASHSEYLKAKETWLAILNQQAKKAEELLLFDHPLQRQIMAAQEIFAQFREVAQLIASGSPPVGLLSACSQNIVASYNRGERPPFPANTELERLYRTFLKTVLNYTHVLDRAIMEGLHEPQRHEINEAQEICRRAYNDFASRVR